MLLSYLILAGFPFLSLILCVPCYQIGYGTYGAPGELTMQRQLDPFTQNQGFDIIDSDAWFLRFQNAQMVGNSVTAFKDAGVAARVTQASWTTTQEQFIETCNNPTGGTTNAALWLTTSWKACQYAGLLKTAYHESQMTLWRPDTVVTYLLPSGRQTVTTVGPGNNPDSNCQELEKVNGAGLSGTVNPSQDYAYARMFDVAMGLSKRYPPNDLRIFADNLPGTGAPWSSIAGPFVLAEKADGSCVVIDFRALPLDAPQC